jgi:hypothetical protein
MIAGLHWTAWLLLFLAVVPGLIVVLRYRAVHADVDPGPETGPSDAEAPSPPPTSGA